jgi:septal ring factor EnvC (AmiA/AmiB activator)
MPSETNKPEVPTSKRLQLNLRLDGREDLLEAIKATAQTKGLSVNAWVLGLLESATGIKPVSATPTGEDLEATVTSVLDKLLADKLVNIKSELKAELLGESAAARQDSEIASITQQLAQTQAQLAAAQQEMTESTKNSKRFSGTQSDLIRTANEKIIVDQQLEEVTRDRDELKQQVETLTTVNQQLQAELDRTQAELASLCEELEKLKRNPAPAIDLSDKAGEVVNFFRTLLPKDAKLPKNSMSKLREILEATED